MKFRFLGTEIYVSFLFAAVITLILLTDRTGFALPTLFSVLIHESGHLLAMYLVGESPRKICLIPASVKIVRAFRKPGFDILIALSGPLANLILTAVLFLNYKAFGNTVSLEYSVLNLVTAAFNLFPVKGLDGGNILLSLLSRRFDEDFCKKTLSVITLLFAAVFAAVGVLFCIKGTFNVSVFIISAYMIITVLLKI